MPRIGVRKPYSEIELLRGRSRKNVRRGSGWWQKWKPKTTISLGRSLKHEDLRCSESGTASAKRRFRVRGVQKTGTTTKRQVLRAIVLLRRNEHSGQNLREGSLRRGGGVPTIIIIKNN